MLPKFKFFFLRILMPALLDTVWRLFPRNKNVVLIIKNDGIGDYILFRNFLRFVKVSDTYNDHKVYVLANLSSKDLAEHLDADIVERFFWYGDHYFMKWKLTRLLMQLQNLRPETIIYPNYSRKFTVDWLVSKVRANHKIGVDGDTLNETTEQKVISDKYYSRLVDTGPVPIHEFERNKIIMEAITNGKCAFHSPYIEKDKLNLIPGNNIVVFTSASTANKTWPPRYFNALVKKIIKKSTVKVILVKGKDDDAGHSELTKGLPESQVSVLPDLDMIGLCELIGSTRLLISGDTVAIHIAAALSVPAVCIAKGDLYGRFIPYPLYMSENIRCIFPPGFEGDAVDFNQYTPYHIDRITPETMYDAIERSLVSIELDHS